MFFVVFFFLDTDYVGTRVIHSVLLPVLVQVYAPVHCA